jgi:hypothetical protein
LTAPKGISQGLEGRLPDFQQVFTWNTADVHTGPAQRQAGVHDRRLQAALARFGNRGERGRTAAEHHEVVPCVFSYFNSR